MGRRALASTDKEGLFITKVSRQGYIQCLVFYTPLICIGIQISGGFGLYGLPCRLASPPQNPARDVRLDEFPTFSGKTACGYWDQRITACIAENGTRVT